MGSRRGGTTPRSFALPRCSGPALITFRAKLRANLLSDAIALAKRGLFDEKVVEDIRAGKGNVDTANDLVALAALFTSQWSTVENKTAATWDEVLRAGELGPMLLAALGVREFAVSAEPDALSEQRKRAFTLFYNAYDETRRAITYLRWHEGDADDLAPSMYKGRGGRGQPPRAAPDVPAAPNAPATPPGGG